MSYILDALKKLEHEKTRKSRGDGMMNISGALFENERSTPSGTAGWKIALVVIVAVLVTFAVTWQFLRPDRMHGKPSVRPATQATRTPPSAVESAPVTVAPTVVPEQPIQPVSVPVPVPSAPHVGQPLRSSQPHKVPVPVAPAAEDDAARIKKQELRSRLKGRNTQAISADETIAAPADIQLSGIAWQEEHRARRAVVNGFLMQEGGVVSGARITDIYQDRVRFSLSGKVFEIPLISSGLPSAGK